MKNVFNEDCVAWMQRERERVNLTLTDIPYGVVNRDDNDLRSLNKGCADETTFDLFTFLNLVYDITISTIIIFCGKEQLSHIYNYFNIKPNVS